jgi:hypothetical protein
MKGRRAVCLLALSLAACQAMPPAPPASGLAPPVPTVAASAVIWAEVPRQICTCHEDALSRVEADLQASRLAVDFNIESGSEGWHVFSVRFDPTRVAAENVTKVLKDAGALIIAPPTGR